MAALTEPEAGSAHPDRDAARRRDAGQQCFPSVGHLLLGTTGRHLTYDTVEYDTDGNLISSIWISRPNGTHAHLLVPDAATPDWQPRP